MAIVNLNIARPALVRFSAKASQYDFASLEANTDQCVAETGLADLPAAEKAASRMTSAIHAYKKRSGDQSRFTVRKIKMEDGTYTVGVWSLGVKSAPAAATGE